MKQELKDKLFADFPGVFADGCKIGCGDGWYDLIRIVAEDIKRYRDNDPEIVITCIYSKLGTMRVLINGGGEPAGETTMFAYNMSQKFCEVCGESGRLHVHEGIYLTRCDTHLAEFVKEHEEWKHEYD